ncbi:hypothetical protein BDV59DRAFT_210129 [Aspergillus ambiguus]|uniref:uncharacterized protein n=1 Tax=Aspergillus ambiguus TaxID=176160 RepID=UPI003CCE1B71
MAPFKVGSIDVKMRDTSRPQAAPATARNTVLPAGHKKRPDCRALVSPVIFDQNQILTLRDGTTIRVDIFRPVGDQKVPAVVMWGPYGKSGTGLLNLHSMPLRAGIPADRLSGYEDFEGLDPAEWVPRGYAIVNIDPRGVAIAPLEGLSDPFREDCFRGGIPWTTFARSIADVLPGRQQQEDLGAMVDPYTITNDYLEDKRADFSEIQVPVYIGASYSSDLHCIGSLRAFEEIPHPNKWLVLHSTQEWYDLYWEDRTQDLDKFFSYYLKDTRNNWPLTSPVRLALLNYTKPPIINREFSDLPWQLPSAVSSRLYLRPDCKLSGQKPLVQSGILHFQADTAEEIAFTFDVPSKMTIVGPSTLVIHASAPDHDDLDIYTHVFKADKEGNILSNLNIPTPDGLPAEEQAKLTENTVFRYWGPNGILRSSRRHVSTEKSGKTWKTLSYERIEKVQPGEVVRLEIQLWPTGIVFEAGEKLVLKICGEKLGVPSLPHLLKEPNQNRGKHALYVGGQWESYLQFFTTGI